MGTGVDGTDEELVLLGFPYHHVDTRESLTVLGNHIIGSPPVPGFQFDFTWRNRGTIHPATPLARLLVDDIRRLMGVAAVVLETRVPSNGVPKLAKAAALAEVPCVLLAYGPASRPAWQAPRNLHVIGEIPAGPPADIHSQLTDLLRSNHGLRRNAQRRRAGLLGAHDHRPLRLQEIVHYRNLSVEQLALGARVAPETIDWAMIAPWAIGGFSPRDTIHVAARLDLPPETLTLRSNAQARKFWRGAEIFHYGTTLKNVDFSVMARVLETQEARDEDDSVVGLSPDVLREMFDNAEGEK